MRALIALAVLVGVVVLLWFDTGQVLAPSVDATGDPVAEVGTTADLELGDIEAAPATFTRTGAGTEPRVVEARAEGAEASEAGIISVTFVVLTEQGDPVEGAQVTVELGWAREGEIAPFTDQRLTADAQGVAVLLLDPVKHKLSTGEVEARVGLRAGASDPQGTYVSAQLDLFPPLDAGPHELRLAPASSVVFAVSEDGSAPVEGARIYLDPAGPDSRVLRAFETDAQGLARIDGLAPGEWRYYVGAPVGERNLRGTFALNVGEQGHVDVQLSDDDLALAVSGRFVDEEGAPIGPDFIDRPVLWVGASLAEGRLVFTDGNGEFRVYRRPSPEVVLQADAGVGGHRYEPEQLRVPFGTTDLVFRRVERLEQRDFYARIVDAESGDPVPGAWLLLTPGESMGGTNLATDELEDGLHRYPYRARSGLRWVVRAEGYAWQIGAVDAAGHGAAEEALEVRLVRGVESHVRVFDAVTEEPIPGALFTDKDGSEVTRADGTGAVILSAPGRLRITAQGYAPRTWYASWWQDRAYLDPLPR